MAIVTGNTFIGDNSNETWTGSQQNQYGIGGNDVLAPNSNNKSYFLYGGNGNDKLHGYDFDDELYGGRGRDELYGYDGWDYLEGGSGNDYLNGGYGNDELYGGRGQDVFAFTTTLNKKQNVDYIGDFKTGSGGDAIWLDRTIFTGIGRADSNLGKKKFEIGKKATKSKTKILYDQKKGFLYYTPDGDDGPKVKFAELNKGQTLVYDDFYIISS